MTLLKNKTVYNLLGVNFLLLCAWLGLKSYNSQTTTALQRLSSFHQEHHQQQRLLHLLKKSPKSLTAPLSRKALKKEIKKIAQKHDIGLEKTEALSQASPRLLQIDLKSTAFLEKDCFAFLIALQQIPGFLGFKAFSLKRSFSDIQSLTSLSTEPRSFVPFHLHLSLLWGIHSGGTIT